MTLKHWLLFPFAFSVQAAPNLKTDLGSSGNQAAALRFESYLKQGVVCETPKANMKRVIVTGFGPFAGGSKNISGLIVRAFANGARFKSGNDVIGSTLDININMSEFQICLLEVATLWDVSAAIIINESEYFKPDLILLTGLGGPSTLSFETGSSNQAIFLGGYLMDGTIATDNKPAQNFVLPPTDPNVPPTNFLSWDAAKAEGAVKKDVAQFGYSTVVEIPARPENDYICNNTAFVVSHATLGYQTLLAGGLISLQVNFAKAPKVGFLHYPQDANPNTSSLLKWITILKKIVGSQNDE